MPVVLVLSHRTAAWTENMNQHRYTAGVNPPGRLVAPYMFGLKSRHSSHRLETNFTYARG